MGDAEQSKHPKSESSISTPEPRENRDPRSADEAQEPQSASGSQSSLSVRRSSIRPAPADYRPSVRDPLTMRPMMVVRAGDAEPVPARLAISIEETKQPPQVRLDRNIASAEPSVSSEALCANGGTSEISSAIPQSPVVPPDLVLETGESGEGSAGVPSTPVAGTIASKRTAPRFIVAALAVITLVSVVIGLRERVASVKPQPAQQTVHVEREPLPSPAIAQSQGAPVIQEPLANVAAPDKSAAEQGAAQPATVDSVPAPIASAAPATTRVSLSLRPLDAKVHLRGHEVPGPPFVFDIAKGEHLAVEVVRFGFVTAKVVLDDKKPIVNFGMLRERWRKQN